MQLTRLRLAGFKSFVDPAEFTIAPGLTGIVGPNGCGKSNLIEALRWVMGETSAKGLRGVEMDDVIFGGTAARPARNLAEVSLAIDNADRTAPAAFNGSDDIEISRRIDRGGGSTYRINGREVRAQDVRLLFADQASGAHSPALVGQGEIGTIINAKPAARRTILEEAAGITGLRSRRHEAELRLRAAETNLDRLEDVIATLEAQLRGLKRQARQATRYRNLSGHIRRAEASLLHFEWRGAGRAVTDAGAELAAVQRIVATCTADAACAAAARTGAAAGLPDLRRAETEAAAGLHRLALERDRLEAEEARLKAAERDLETRLAQIAEDAAREQRLVVEAEAAVVRLDGAFANITGVEADSEAKVVSAERQRAAAEASVVELEARLREAGARLAASEARREAMERRHREGRARIDEFSRRRDELASEREHLAQDMRGQAPESATDDAVVSAREARTRCQRRAGDAESMLDQTVCAEATARDRWQEISAQVASAEAELRALGELVADDKAGPWPPLLESLTVDPGFERALAGALGDDLMAATDAAAPTHWCGLGSGNDGAGAGLDPALPLPPGAEALDRYVEAPLALARRLAQVGVVEREAGLGLQSRLRQGQRLVSRDGDLWRWDGYTAAADIAGPAARRLDQRKRLEVLRAARVTIDKAGTASREAFETARAANNAARGHAEQSRRALAEADAALGAALEARSRSIEAQSGQAARMTAIDDTSRRVEADLGEAERQAATAAAELGQLNAHDDQAAMATLAGSLSDNRTVLGVKQEGLEALKREAAVRAARHDALATEQATWQSRIATARDHLESLATRREQAERELVGVKDRPAAIREERAALFERVTLAEATRDRAADALAVAETDLAAHERADKMAQAALARAREDQLRAEAKAAQAAQQEGAVVARVRDKLDCRPQAVAAIAEIEPGAEPPDLDGLRTRFERLRRERDTMGPVNLRAEAEAGEVEEQFETLQTERADLQAAIARLRQGISNLNREGRQRLLDAFEQVNAHFSRLFERLFGGGRGHLALTDSDDPLEAGLEIMASPRGKRLQVISLLSGGEQALTATALLFGVFLTNPAPICVLDEVDAPLDDANVERFCALVRDIARDTATRFAIVTHHPLTMSRMDRLFGVTMAEPGLSRMVSVDLSRAVDLQAAE